MPQTSQAWAIANESVIAAELDGEAVLLNVETGIYFGLNAVGTEIWRMISAGAGEDEIIAGILDAFDADPAELRSDVAAFLHRLESEGLVSFAER